MTTTDIRALAHDCGATDFSPPPMRAVRGVSFTYEQLEVFSQRLLEASGGQQLSSEDTGDAVRRALEDFEKRAAHLGGCTNHGCLINPPREVGTNGMCQCYRNDTKAMQMMYAGQQLAKAVRAQVGGQSA
jgi:hypothetical protein